jgi:hypothetical protein
VAASDGHDGCCLWYLSPDLSGRIVSGEPSRIGANDSRIVSSEAGVLALCGTHVRLALLATREHTPSGGGTPGSVLNGVTLGSRKYMM